jgi:hypothetical protein
VEFPPLTYLAVNAIGAGTARAPSGRALVATQLVCDLVVAGALALGWGRRAAIVWLALLLPFLWDGWIFARIDLLSVALAIGGVALVQRRAERAGGLALAASMLAKLWPVVLLPRWLVERRQRALAWAVGAAALGGTAWLAVGGTDGIRQVTSFRGATGWQVESTFGGLEYLFSSGRTRGESGAARIGTQPDWSKPVLFLAIVVVVAVAWWLASIAHGRGDATAVEHASVAAVGATLVLAPIISPQYLVWLLPFVAVLAADRLVLWLTASTLVITAVIAHFYLSFLHGGLVWKLALVGRNVLLTAVVVTSIVRLVVAARPRHLARQRPVAAQV